MVLNVHPFLARLFLRFYKSFVSPFSALLLPFFHLDAGCYCCFVYCFYPGGFSYNATLTLLQLPSVILVVFCA